MAIAEVRPPASEDPGLLQRARDGDPEAFGHLIQPFEARLFSQAQALCRDPQSSNPSHLDTPFLVQSPVDLDAWLRQLDPDSPTPSSHSPTDAPRRMLAWIEPHEPILSAIRLGAARPHCRLPIAFERGLEADTRLKWLLTETSLLLNLRAVACLQNGQPGEAYSDLQTVLRLLDFARQQPGLGAMRSEWDILANGRLPGSLEPLVPDYLPSLPTDPLQGAPPAYQSKSSHHFTLHTPGADGADQGGRLPGSTLDSWRRRHVPDILRHGDWVWWIGSLSKQDGFQ